jgi:hypothetical protein
MNDVTIVPFAMSSAEGPVAAAGAFGLGPLDS